MWTAFLSMVSATAPSIAQTSIEATYQKSVRPLIQEYCYECHSGKEANADIDFARIKTAEQINDAFEIWESAAEQVHARGMPPEESPQPTQEERLAIKSWYESFVNQVEPQPAIFTPRRLSVQEYRNSLRTVLGFDLEVAIIEAEQTVSETSMVIKLLPTDPPGESGFKNDTHKNPLTVTVWDQYSYLVDLGLEELFSNSRKATLEKWTGPIDGNALTLQQAKKLVQQFVPRAWRRPVSVEELTRINSNLDGLTGKDLTDALKTELKSALMSPSFIYRGLRTKLEPNKRQRVDSYEYAERLSYFLWADMPDEALLEAAGKNQLHSDEQVAKQIARMLASPKARSLSDVFGMEWFTLQEIEKVSNNPPQMVALKSQPLDYLNYLFTENRPLLELVDSDTAFINPFTARMYGSDAKQMKRYVKQRGIEVEIVPNQKILLKATKVRGGIMTMPGVLAMNKGPIIRGTWVLERLLGEHLPEPPPDVGQVPRNKNGQSLTFRQRFELHRSNKTCAICHDKIDPLGFGLEGFNSGGAYVLKDYKPTKKEIKKGQVTKNISSIDVSGKFPSGETFEGVIELKKILTTSKRRQVIENIVKRTMSYALCRKLKVHDQPTVQSIVKTMDAKNGTWQDLFLAIATSPQFRETISPRTRSRGTNSPSTKRTP